MLDKAEINEQIEGNKQRNSKLLSVLVGKKVSVDAERSIDYHFWSFEQNDAAMLARDLYQQDYLIRSIAPVEQDGSKAWSIEAQIQHSPKVAASSKQTEVLVYLAAKSDSIYDGWGTKI